jgi:hypothetical protein
LGKGHLLDLGLLLFAGHDGHPSVSGGI